MTDTEHRIRRHLRAPEVSPSGCRIARDRTYDYKLPFVIGASAIGTVIEWYDFYLYAVLRLVPGAASSSRGDPTALLLSAAGDVRRRLRRAPVRRDRLRAHRRHVGRKFAFLLTVTHHGRRDRPRRPAADLRADRHPGADHPRHPAHAPGPGARRRVRRRRDLRGRARARPQARPVHQRASRRPRRSASSSRSP